MCSLRRLIAGFFVLCAFCAATPSLTRVRDTLYRADGMPLTGVVIISWPAFTASDGSTIAANSMNVPVTNGNFRADLIPTTNAQPPATYAVRIVSDGKDQTLETWSVPPSAGPLTIQAVLISSSGPGSGGAGGGGVAGNLQIGDVSGLSSQLAERPVMGSGYAASRAAVIDSTGAIAAAAGTSSDCVRVDGSSGPCGGSGSGGGGASFVDAEVPTGVVDGANRNFTLTQTPSPASSVLFSRNGLLLQQGNDYTVAANLISFRAGSPPQPGDVLQASYRTGGSTVGSNTAAINGNNTFGAYIEDFGLSTLMLPRGSGKAPSGSGSIVLDTGSTSLKYNTGSAVRTLPTIEGANTFSGAETFNGSVDMTTSSMQADRAAASDPATCNAAKNERYWNSVRRVTRRCTGPNTWSDDAAGYSPGISGSFPTDLQTVAGEVISVMRFAAKWANIDNGVVDATAAFQAAVNYAASSGAAGVYVPVPANYYLIKGSVAVSRPVRIYGSWPKIVCGAPNYGVGSGSSGYCFNVTSGGVTFEKLWFDGTALGGPTAPTGLQSVVNGSGNTVTWQSGDDFSAILPGQLVMIAGVNHFVTSVNLSSSPQALTILDSLASPLAGAALLQMGSWMGPFGAATTTTNNGAGPFTVTLVSGTPFDASGAKFTSGQTIAITTNAIYSATYTGGSPTLAGAAGQTCTASFPGGSGTATIALTGTNAIAGGTAFNVTFGGSEYTYPPTSAVLSTGTATCSGTVTIAATTVQPTFAVSTPTDSSHLNLQVAIAAAKYTSGAATVTGNPGQTCRAMFPGGSGTATIALTGANALAPGTAFVITGGGAYTTTPVTAVLGNNSAVCSGTVNISATMFSPGDQATAVPWMGLTENRTVIGVTGSATAMLDNVRIEDCRFTNFDTFAAPDPVDMPNQSLNRWYGVEAQYASNLLVWHNRFENIAGAPIWFKGTRGTVIEGNAIRESWQQNITSNADNTRIRITNNDESGWGLGIPTMVSYPDASNPTSAVYGNPVNYWGGAVDLMGQNSYTPDIGPDRDCIISENHLAGRFMYGAAIRSGSTQGCLIANNVIGPVDAGSSITSQVSYISLSPRVVAGQDATSRGIRNVTVADNIAYAGGTNHIGVYVQNATGGSLNLAPAEAIDTHDNTFAARTVVLAISSLTAGNIGSTVTTLKDHQLYWNQQVIVSGTGTTCDGTWNITLTGLRSFTIPCTGNSSSGTVTIDNAFAACVIYHGQDGGIIRSAIHDNICGTRGIGGPVSAGIAITNTSGSASDITISGNKVTYFTSPRLEPALTVTAVSDNGSGKVRLTFANLPPTVTNSQWVQVYGFGTVHNCTACQVSNVITGVSGGFDLTSVSYSSTTIVVGDTAQFIAGASSNGIQIGSNVSEIQVMHNTLNSFGTQLYIGSSAGANLRWCNENSFVSTVFAGAPAATPINQTNFNGHAACIGRTIAYPGASFTGQTASIAPQSYSIPGYNLPPAGDYQACLSIRVTAAASGGTSSLLGQVTWNDGNGMQTASLAPIDGTSLSHNQGKCWWVHLPGTFNISWQVTASGTAATPAVFAVEDPTLIRVSR